MPTNLYAGCGAARQQTLPTGLTAFYGIVSLVLSLCVPISFAILANIADPTASG